MSCGASGRRSATPRPRSRGCPHEGESGRGGSIHGDPGPIERELEHDRAVLGEGLTEGRLEVGITLDPDAACAEAPGDGREIDRTLLCSATLSASPFVLPHPDRAVTLVVEHEDDD